MIAKNLLAVCLLLDITKVAAFASSSPVSEHPITMEEVATVQAEWMAAIVRISNAHLNGGDATTVTETALEAAHMLYGYIDGMNVLFKPTKAAEHPFRPTAVGALSYFIGGEGASAGYQVAGGYSEDKGFALGPGGVGYKLVTFDNHQVVFHGETAQAMGEYYFTSAADDTVTKVEYTFGYKKNSEGKVKIYLHHSSLPYGA
jgi:hypothetical protein